MFMVLYDFFGQRYDRAESFFLQFPGHRAEDTGGSGLPVLVDQYHRVLVKSHVAAVRAPNGVPGTDHHALNDIFLLNLFPRLGNLNGSDYHVADSSIPPSASAKHPETADGLRPGVISH